MEKGTLVPVFQLDYLGILTPSTKCFWQNQDTVKSWRPFYLAKYAKTKILGKKQTHIISVQKVERGKVKLIQNDPISKEDNF